jgi:hypothetical protein
MTNDKIRISMPVPMSHIRQEIDADNIWVHWGTDKEIKLSELLKFVMKQVERHGTEENPPAPTELIGHTEYLTKLEQVAAHAMQGLLASSGSYTPSRHDTALIALEFAHALLSKTEKGKE